VWVPKQLHQDLSPLTLFQDFRFFWAVSYHPLHVCTEFQTLKAWWTNAWDWLCNSVAIGFGPSLPPVVGSGYSGVWGLSGGCQTVRPAEDVRPWHMQTSYVKGMELTPCSRGILEKLIITLPINYPPFMEPEGLLLCSQEPTTGPCPEPDESSPHFFTLFL
jgi:hypothetical protein